MEVISSSVSPGAREAQDRTSGSGQAAEVVVLI